MSTAVRRDVVMVGAPQRGSVKSAGVSHLRVVPPRSVESSPACARAAVLARRRFAVLILAVMVIAGAVFAGRAVASGQPEGGASTVTVRAGETLSQIAAREMPEWANGAAVVELQRVNDLASPRVGSGQRIVIPG